MEGRYAVEDFRMSLGRGDVQVRVPVLHGVSQVFSELYIPNPAQPPRFPAHSLSEAKSRVSHIICQDKQIQTLQGTPMIGSLQVVRSIHSMDPQSREPQRNKVL